MTRIRFEGLRMAALSASWDAPLSFTPSLPRLRAPSSAATVGPDDPSDGPGRARAASREGEQVTQKKESVAAKVVGVVAALAASWLAQRLIDLVWRRVLGHKPPKPEDESDARLAEIAAAATLTGAAIALSRVLATRGAARVMARR